MASWQKIMAHPRLSTLPDDMQENALRSALGWLFQQSGTTILRVEDCVKIAGTPQILQTDS